MVLPIAEERPVAVSLKQKEEIQKKSEADDKGNQYIIERVFANI